MTALFSLLLYTRLSLKASWVYQPREFPHADGVSSPDRGFLVLVLGSYPLTIMCWWSLMSYSGSETRV